MYVCWGWCLRLLKFQKDFLFQCISMPSQSHSSASPSHQSTPPGWGWLSVLLLLQENAAERLMDMYRVGMDSASAAIHKRHSFQLLAVCYWEEHWKRERKRLFIFYFLKDINLLYHVVWQHEWLDPNTTLSITSDNNKDTYFPTKIMWQHRVPFPLEHPLLIKKHQK